MSSHGEVSLRVSARRGCMFIECSIVSGKDVVNVFSESCAKKQHLCCLMAFPTLVLPRERGRVSAVAEGPWLPVRDAQGRQRSPDRQTCRPDVAIADAWERQGTGARPRREDQEGPGAEIASIRERSDRMALDY